MGRRDGTGHSGQTTGEGAGPVVRPNLTGDLDELLGHRPVFRTRVNGYDRLQVDNYAAWVESELSTLRREVDHLLVRFGESSAELEISRRLLADVPRNREVFPVSDRVQEMLQLAADEAEALREAGVQDADRILAEARTEADARLRKAHEIKEMAVIAADELNAQARQLRAEANGYLDKARHEAAELLREAAAERDRLAEEAARERDRVAAVAEARLAEVQAEVDDLRRQRDQARQSLRGLTDRIGEALQAVAAVAPDDMRGTNVAVEGMITDDVRVLVGRPAPVPS
jgi:cell division septum initiation protein DivIVA